MKNAILVGLALGASVVPRLAFSETAEVESKKSLPLYGLSFGLGVEDTSGVNFEPENYNNVLSYSFSTSWQAGKLLAKDTFWEPLKASASFSLSHELAGNSELYRGTQFSPSSRYYSNRADSIFIDDTGGIVNVESVPRGGFDGADKRLNYSDISLSLEHSKIAELASLGGARLSGGLRGALPISVSSRNADLYTNLALSMGLRWKLMEDKLSLSLNLGATKHFGAYKNASIKTNDDTIDVNGVPYDPPTIYPAKGGKSTNFGLSSGLRVGYEISDSLSASARYSLSASRSYGISDCTLEVAGSGTVDVCQSNEELGVTAGGDWRNSQAFGIGLSYTVNDWLGLGASLSTESPLRQADGHGYRQPFVNLNRNGYTSVGVSADITVEEFYKVVAKR
ncbi:MAG: hypothetical protein HY698_12435 [Deltaproteobacteria bacterium]|nr:hypothetical protein [Deltaproteobacteria bacterium]